VNWHASGPLVLDLLKLPDNEVWQVLRQVYDRWNYKNMPF